MFFLPENRLIMKSVLLILPAALAASVVHAQPPAIPWKPGLWESRTLQSTVNGEDWLPHMKESREKTRKVMETMPPDQRKAMQDMLAGQPDDPLVSRECISAGMLKNQQPGLPLMYRPRPSCAALKIHLNGNRSTFEQSCPYADGTIAIKGEIVTEGDQVTTTEETVYTGADGRKRPASLTKRRSAFISSDCGGIKPLDQISAELERTTPIRWEKPK